VRAGRVKMTWWPCWSEMIAGRGVRLSFREQEVASSAISGYWRGANACVDKPTKGLWQPGKIKLGNPVMSDSPRAFSRLIFGALSALLISSRLACAQTAVGDTTWAALDVTAAINRAIEESNESVELREKLVRRFSECSLMYGGLSTLTSNKEAKKSYVHAQEATAEIESAIAKPLQREKRLELEEAARRSVALMLRTVKAQGDKEVGPLLKNCKALNDLNEIKAGLRELSAQ
jgi:hypothetical protein